VLACCTRLDCEEFVKGEDARLAAFPAWNVKLANLAQLSKTGSGCVTFLPLVEDRWAGVVDALFVLILVRLATAFMNALLRHDCYILESAKRMVKMPDAC